MTTRKAVIIDDNGGLSELPTSDTLAGAGGATPTTGASGDFTINASTQVFAYEDIDTTGDLIVNGLLVFVA